MRVRITVEVETTEGARHIVSEDYDVTTSYPEAFYEWAVSRTPRKDIENPEAVAKHTAAGILRFVNSEFTNFMRMLRSAHETRNRKKR